jgi:hypothetical protein
MDGDLASAHHYPAVALPASAGFFLSVAVELPFGYLTIALLFVDINWPHFCDNCCGR